MVSTGSAATGIATSARANSGRPPIAYSVHVRDGIGRRDDAEVKRIVDDRHTKVRRRDDRLRLAHLIHRSVVATFDADQQLRRQARTSRPGHELLEHCGSKLAPASPTGRQAGEAHRPAADRGRVPSLPGIRRSPIYLVHSPTWNPCATMSMAYTAVWTPRVMENNVRLSGPPK